MRAYWTKRQTDQLNKLYETTMKQLKRQLAKQYSRCAEETINELNRLWIQIQEALGGRQINITDFYQYNRLYEMLGKFNKQLTRLGLKEIKIMEPGLIEMYKATGAMLGTHFNLTSSINEAIVESIVNRIWCTDGKMWSTRIWNNKTLFQQRLMDGLVDMVGRGVSHDDVISRFREEFNVEYHKAQRLVRTELEYVQTQATLDSYIKAGVQWYNVLDAGDYPGSRESPERECIRCHEIADGGPYSISTAQVEVNLPPFHPNCRCVITPFYPS